MGEAREIYLEACAKFAKAFEADGFKWLKSKQALSKREADLEFSIQFQSSFRNHLFLRETVVPDSYESDKPGRLFLPLAIRLWEIAVHGSVAFSIRVSAKDKRLKEWLNMHTGSVATDGPIASTNIGYLAPQRQWLDINLANRRRRTERVVAAIALVRRYGFEYFELFRSPEIVLSKLAIEEVEGMSDFGAIEYSMCHGGPVAGRKTLEMYFAKYPNSFKSYQASLAQFRIQGIPKWWGSELGSRLAKAALLTGIEA